MLVTAFLPGGLTKLVIEDISRRTWCEVVEILGQLSKLWSLDVDDFVIDKFVRCGRC